MRKFPGTYPVYKKNGAAQFTVIPPKVDAGGRITKNGAILLEVASAVGDKAYDWKAKISFAIGVNDIALWFNDPNAQVKLIHKTPESSLMKTLEVIPGEGQYSGTYQLKLTEKDSSNNAFRSIFVPVTNGEYTILLRLFMHAMPLLIGWDNESQLDHSA
jgi:hypothetical protein